MSSLLDQAMHLHQSGRLQEAEKAYLTVLQATPRQFDALRLLGCVYLQTYRPGEAIAYLEKASKIKPREAEVLGNLGMAYAETGDFQKALPCYKKAIAFDPKFTSAHYNKALAHIRLGEPQEAIEELKATVTLNPKHEEAWINLGICLAKEGELDKAEALFEKLLDQTPSSPPILNNYANVLHQKGRFNEAKSFYLKALTLKPDYPKGLINYGTVLRDSGDLDGAKESYQKALAIDPRSCEALNNYGLLQQYWGDYPSSLACFDKALLLNQEDTVASWNKALALLALGDYENGWSLHEKGLGHAEARGLPLFKEKKWDGSSLAGKKILLWSEQGLGDALQFVRYAPLCKKSGAAEVTLLCPESLKRLFEGSELADRVLTQADLRKYDCQASLMSLPYLFQTRLATVPAEIPYIKPPKDSVKEEDLLPSFDGKKKKVGLVWAGSPRDALLSAHLIDKRRSLTLEAFLPLLAIPNINFVSLQKGEAQKQIGELGLKEKLLDPMDRVRDFADTASLLEGLDLVITVDTSVAHLAGALGKPVWILSRLDGCWRWLQNQKTSPWYPTARIFGQKKYGEWQETVERIAKELAQFSKV